MNATLPPLYTNELSAEVLRTLDKSSFTDQQLVGLNEQGLAIVNQQQAYTKSHPLIAIYRVATKGSQTRNGGVIQQATTECEITLDNGQQVRVAQIGDIAVYADGSTAQIVTGAGQGNSHWALVGSQLSNGDEIVNTPQCLGLFVEREGVPMPDDFLPTIEG